MAINTIHIRWRNGSSKARLNISVESISLSLSTNRAWPIYEGPFCLREGHTRLDPIKGERDIFHEYILHIVRLVVYSFCFLTEQISNIDVSVATPMAILPSDKQTCRNALISKGKHSLFLSKKFQDIPIRSVYKHTRLSTMIAVSTRWQDSLHLQKRDMNLELRMGFCQVVFLCVLYSLSWGPKWHLLTSIRLIRSKEEKEEENIVWSNEKQPQQCYLCNVNNNAFCSLLGTKQKCPYKNEKKENKLKHVSNGEYFPVFISRSNDQSSRIRN